MIPRHVAAAFSRWWRALVAASAVALVLAAPAGADSGDVAYDEGLQWGLRQIGAEQAWTVGRGAGVTIAVVDSGVALDHEDLAVKLVQGVACQGTNGDPGACVGEPTDDDGHGSHVAGIAAAATGNGVGIAGVAPDATILPVKVLFRACPTCASSGKAADVAAAVRWAADAGADVINLSLGSTSSTVFGPGFADAVRYAWSRGAIPVVAAGNDYVLTADLGDAPAVVVSATDRDDDAPPYSNGIGAARWAVAAPGGDGRDDASTCAQGGEPRGILSAYWADDDPVRAYACLSGTSMAAPHVSGALAVLIGAGRSPSEAVDALLASAVDLGAPGFDPVFGFGRIDLAAAVATPVDGAVGVAFGTPGGTDGVAPSTATDAEVGDAGDAQRFVDGDPAEVPPLLVVVAVVALVVAAASVELGRRRLLR